MPSFRVALFQINKKVVFSFLQYINKIAESEKMKRKVYKKKLTPSGLTIHKEWFKPDLTSWHPDKDNSEDIVELLMTINENLILLLKR